MTMLSFLKLFNNSDLTMTENKVLIRNWQHKNITFKELTDKGFQLPIYYLFNREVYSANNFSSGDLKAFEYDFNPNDFGFNIQDIVKSLIP